MIIPHIGTLAAITILRIRAQRGESHPFTPRIGEFPDECGLCGKPKDDPRHELREDE